MVIGLPPGATKSVDYNRRLEMRRTFAAGFLVVAMAFATSCSRGQHTGHATEREAPEPPPPTPDTTPITALRTPAGLVLGVAGTPASGSPSPATTSAPVPTTTPAP